jgi:serine phosphatase RsbU (regulator of sigma subunit)/tetratricopeptide (TPR) repeat protein
LHLLQAQAQHFSITHTLFKAIDFESSNLKKEQNEVLESTRLDTWSTNAVDYNNSVNDYFNICIAQAISAYEKNDYKKSISTLVETENKIYSSNASPYTKSLFHSVRFMIYNNYNLRADEELLMNELKNMPSILKYCLLYNIFFENCCFYDLISKTKTDEFLTVAAQVSCYDYIRALSTLINNKNYIKVDKWVNLRDSTLRNCHVNSDIINSSIIYNFSKSEINQKIQLEQIISLNDLGVISRNNKKYDEAISYFSKAIEAQNSFSIKKLEGDIHTNLGLAYTFLGRFENAEHEYLTAFDVFKKVKNTRKQAEQLNFLAKNKFLSNKNNSALNLCNESIEISTVGKDYKNLSNSYLLLSDIYSDEGDYQESNKFFKLYNDARKLMLEEGNVQKLLKAQKESTIYDYELEARENYKTQSIKTAELLLTKLESAKKEKEILEMQRAADLRDSKLAYSALEKERANQALALTEKSLLLKQQEIQQLESQSKLNSLEASVNIKKLELAQNRNFSYFQSQLINELKVSVIRRNQRYLQWAVAGLILLLVVVIAIFMRGVKNRKEIQIQNFKLSKKNEEIVAQRNIILEKNKEIIDSINYALKIQTAMLPSEADMRYALGELFIFYRPKDIVSGDFYWFHQTEEYYFYAVADCTGHGVPGGFMSMLGISLLNEIVNEKAIYEPNDILDILSAKTISVLKQTESKSASKDGMDITLCRINKSKTELRFAGANNDLWLIRNNELVIYKADKQPVGFHYGAYKQFNQHVIELKQNDRIFSFTDGYADQFGGQKGKKFKYKNLKNLFLSIYYLPERQQKELTSNTFDTWKGELEQVDDILILGLKIS